MDNDLLLLKAIGLSESKAKETLKNAQITSNIKIIVNEISKYKDVKLVNGVLIYHLACKLKPQITDQVSFLSEYIAKEKLDSILKIDCALQYLLDNIQSVFNIKEFENNCGIGVVITPEEIEKQVEKFISIHKNDIIKKRYNFNTGILMRDIRNSLKWADGQTLKNEIDLQLFDILGPKENSNPAVINKTCKVSKDNANKTFKISGNISNVSKTCDQWHVNDGIKAKLNFHAPGENYKTEGYVITPNTFELLNKHLLTTKGEVRTRFPPEPNGLLHIGHAKAININFGYAVACKGSCYLRYDDTNPEKEEEKFFTAILDIVRWLGYEPAKITHSSDYFDILYQWAVLLIEKNLAYVCHQKSSEIKGFNPPPSSWRNRPICESLNLFKNMREGILDEGEATLRMKVTLEEGKQDPVAYRIKYSYHHRTKDNWCIYPTYDFTHCLCDSIENITHSLCTKEFQSRRSSYYWLCNALDIYCPVQWEYGRLNLSYTVVSKRKIAKLIEKKIVDDWDDPRLFTLSALRRRGLPSQAINAFCAQMGVTGAQAIVDPIALEATTRDYLNINAPRSMVVTKPLKVIMNNYNFNGPQTVSVPDFPGETDKGLHTVKYDRVIYIDSSDFMEVADSQFKRLTLKQPVGLKYVGVLLCVEKVVKDLDGSIINLIARQEYISEKNKPKAFIQWVSQPFIIQIRSYDRLFHHKNPEDVNEVPKGFLSDVNYRSKKETIAYTHHHDKKSLRPFEKRQFERIGFFSVDPDSRPNKLIFNRTVTLRDGGWKL